MGLGLGISVDWASLVPYYAQVASAFKARVEADGGTVESMSCLKADLKVLNPIKPPAFDSDYQAVLDYAATQGYTTPSAAQQTLQNTLVTDLKTAGVWSKLDAFSVYATDGDANFALIDWKRLTTQTATNSPTFTSNSGYRGDGVSARIQSGFVASTDGVNYQLTSASMFKYRYQVRTAGQAQAYEGVFKAGNTYSLIASSPLTNCDNYINQTSNPIFVSQITAANPAFQLLTRNGNSLATYVDGVLEDSNSSSPLSVPDVDMWSLAANNGSSGTFFSDVGISIDGYGGDLSAEQADFNTAIQNYISAL